MQDSDGDDKEMWEGISKEEWNDWRWQFENRITTVDQLKAVVNLTPEEEEGVARCLARLRMAITPTTQA